MRACRTSPVVARRRGEAAGRSRTSKARTRRSALRPRIAEGNGARAGSRAGARDVEGTAVIVVSAGASRTAAVSVRSPSILSADFARLGEEIAMCEAAAPTGFTSTSWTGASCRTSRSARRSSRRCASSRRCRSTCTSWSSSRRSIFDDFASAGASGMTIHAEVAPHLHRQLDRIRELGCRAGVALNPATPLSAVCEVIPELDLLLIMTVNPGFGGQKFIPYSIDKMRRARAMLDEGAQRRRARGGRRHRPRHDSRRVGRGRRHVRRRQRDLLRRAIRRAEIGALRALCGVTV